MGWQDPSPRARGRSPAGNPAAQPGYGDPVVRLSFLTIAARALVALLAGGLVYAGAHKGFGAWLGPQHAMVALAISAALAAGLGWLVLRVLMRMPDSAGHGRRGWDDSSGLAFGDSDVAEAVVGVVGIVIDATTD